MATEHVIIFDPFAFEPGQRIRIASGPRRGDWQVVAVSARKVTLRCPVSGREVEWDRFCYHVDERDTPWPAEE